MTSSEHLFREWELARQPVVLIVEDDVLVRFSIADYLRDARYALIEAANAVEALEVFASGVPVDVVFADVQMPGEMDGLMLVRWVHERHPDIQVLERVMLPSPLASLLRTHSLRNPTGLRQWGLASAP
jgi:CheY-like chemotaxis protein